MSSLTLEMPAPRLAWPAWREHGLAIGVAIALHAGLAYVLLHLAHQTPLPTPLATVLTTELISLPAPVIQPPAPLVAEPAVAPPPAEAPVEAPAPEQADLAFKRAEQAREEQALRLQRERQQRRAEAQRQERLAREEAARQAQLEAQQLAEARRLEAERVAAARAEAQAASRQYLPIAKQAPDYPAKALERKIEGECTVAYTVNAAGRVEDPQVVGNCHPFFVKPSLAAARTFRYQPRVVNGQAVAVANVKNTFSYRIE